MTVTKNIYNSVEKSKENISMKIDIITLHYIRNYGSVLQTYATQAKFEAMGYEAEIVDYVRPNAEDDLMIGEDVMNYLTRNIRWLNQEDMYVSDAIKNMNGKQGGWRMEKE